jgi:two-component system, OmpR family, sensor histidine kinase BaeS
MTARVPLRHSLLLRLFAASVSIAGCAIAATAWLTMWGTTRAIQRNTAQAAELNTRTYQELVAYAATHRSWDGVGPVLDALGARTGQRIRLTTPEGGLIAGSPDAVTPYMVVDPLHVDPAAVPAHFEYIDDRAVGPFLLSPDERQHQQAEADRVSACVNAAGHTVRATTMPSGRTTLSTAAPENVRRSCHLDAYNTRLPETQRAAILELNELMRDCLHTYGVQAKVLDPVAWFYLPRAPGVDADHIIGCIATGRRIQLGAYVAAPARLFVDHTPTAAPTDDRFTLGGANAARTAGAALLVLTVTVVITTGVGARLVRPLRALTAATRYPPDRRPGTHVRRRDEIGALADAFNDMSRRRQRAEAQRRAMVRDIAHELRTPLSNIRSWLEASEDGLAPPVTDPELTSSLLAEALQLQHIVDDLQDLADADAGTLRLDRRTVRVEDLVRQVVAAHRGSADAAGVTLRAAGDCAAQIDADPVRIAQTLTNLVTNAIRYTPPGGTVTVGADVEPDHVVLTVTDTGRGISTEDLPYVFDRFWRADPSRNRDTGGSGLGLAIVRNLVEAHGGTVGATSEPGRGSTFTVRLPATPGTATAPTALP